MIIVVLTLVIDAQHLRKGNNYLLLPGAYQQTPRQSGSLRKMQGEPGMYLPGSGEMLSHKRIEMRQRALQLRGRGGDIPDSFVERVYQQIRFAETIYLQFIPARGIFQRKRLYIRLKLVCAPGGLRGFAQDTRYER